MYNAGRCDMKQLVCLVLDEAHRAIGDYAYCAVVRKVCSGVVLCALRLVH